MIYFRQTRQCPLVRAFNMCQHQLVPQVINSPVSDRWRADSFDLVVFSKAFSFSPSPEALSNLVAGFLLVILSICSPVSTNRFPMSAEKKKHSNPQWWIQEFPEGAGTPTTKVVVLTYFLGRELHENEIIWTRGRASLAPLCDLSKKYL